MLSWERGGREALNWNLEVNLGLWGPGSGTCVLFFVTGNCSVQKGSREAVRGSQVGSVYTDLQESWANAFSWRRDYSLLHILRGFCDPKM